ncbi:hypothetical protein D0962_17840 [Leptolyngbyaceae cyanobacterium CCMR0082]|uniref:Uncharacterized protein n=1 Tax=Adonisia turfae CCMR0082 TaxID=2304604 RepID=A0A6M0S822_9CYAN|nr:hypothetical protein [Adonisia turfae]NEZ64627.1 hypothetical protein [Adonisia turfae CCMR0082]
MKEQANRFPDSPRWAYGLDGYNYSREPLIREIKTGSEVVGIVTRNAYDCEILNTPLMLIADVDLGDPRLNDGCFVQTEREALLALRDAVSNPMQWLPKYQQSYEVAYQGKSPLEPSFWDSSNRWIDQHRLGLGFRVYRTAGGLRYICTTHLWEAGRNSENDFLRYVYSDYRYRRLCKAQQTFRARLTPKPWRIRQECIEHPDRVEWRNKPGEGIARTAEYVKTVGSNVVLPELSGLLGTHDSTTLALIDHDVKTYLA